MSEQPKGRILVADDDDAVRNLLVRLFIRNGYDCDGVADGQEAINKLENASYDLLVSDIHMPGNEDLRVAKVLTGHSARLPVIFLTGNPSIETAAQSVRLNVVAYLVKPAPTEELLRLVGEATARHQLYRTVRSSRERLQEWAGDITRVEQLLQSGKGPQSGPVDAYLDVTLQNILNLLVDWQQILRSSTPSPTLNEATRQHTLVEGLHDAITVLEKTKQSFKSKDLAELRKRLETLVRESGTPPNP